MSDLQRLLHLRALREARAGRAAALARSQSDAAEALRHKAARQLDGHDLRQARREARLHDAMLADGFDGADLRAAADRALHGDATREGLTIALTAAEAAASVAQEASRQAALEWRHSLRRLEKLQGLARDLTHTSRLHRESLTEAEAEDAPRIPRRTAP